jgi:hypothetical protein
MTGVKCKIDCAEMHEVKAKADANSNEIVRLDKEKVSWGKLGATVLVLLGIIATGYWRTSDIRAEELKKAAGERAECVDKIKTYSIKQDIILERVKSIELSLDKAFEKRDKQREHEQSVFHERINKVQDKLEQSERRILEAIGKLKK